MSHEFELIHRQIAVLNRLFVGFLGFLMKLNSATLLQLSEYISFLIEVLSINTMITIT